MPQSSRLLSFSRRATKYLSKSLDTGMVSEYVSISCNRLLIGHCNCASCVPQVNSIMTAAAKSIPTYQWLTALPQLVSRICHQSNAVVTILKNIISEVLRTNPQQALWTMAAVSKSTLRARNAVANEIINRARNAVRTPEERMTFEQVGCSRR